MSAQQNPGTTIPEGYLRNSKGHLVPENLVKPIDKLRDQMIFKLFGYAGDLNAQIKRFRAHTMDDIEAFLKLAAEEYGLTYGGSKGNITLTSYDACFRVTIQVADQLSFGPELQFAKQLIDNCIHRWAQGVRDEIRALVASAFDVDKTGAVNRSALFALRRLDIDDPEWRQAMNAIGDSISVVGTREYIRFHTRRDARAPWAAITIDLANA